MCSVSFVGHYRATYVHSCLPLSSLTSLLLQCLVQRAVKKRWWKRVVEWTILPVYRLIVWLLCLPCECRPTLCVRAWYVGDTCDVAHLYVCRCTQMWDRMFYVCGERGCNSSEDNFHTYACEYLCFSIRELICFL